MVYNRPTENDSSGNYKNLLEMYIKEKMSFSQSVTILLILQPSILCNSNNETPLGH